jgi:flagellar hook-length control protein FliK
LIQLTALNIKGMNNASKMSAKGSEESTAFIDLLQQISGNGEEKKEVEGQLSANLFLLTLPIEKLPIETPPVTADESTIKLQAHPALSGFTELNPNNEDFLLGHSEQKLVKQIEPRWTTVPQETEQLIANQPNPVQALSVQDGKPYISVKENQSANPALQDKLPEMKQTDSHDHALLELFDKNEQPLMPGIQSPNTGASLHSSSSVSESSGRVVFEMPVRAEHLAKDVTKFLADAIDVQQMNNKIEASFSLKPEHLGKVDVKVFIHDGNVTAEFLTSNTFGKDLLETQVQVLRTALEQQGFQVDKINISQQSLNFSGPFSQKGDSHARQGQQESKKRNGQASYLQEEEYRDYAVESLSVSQINTTV